MQVHTGVATKPRRHELQHTASHCNTLQHTATHCNTLRHTATQCNETAATKLQQCWLQHTAPHSNTCTYLLLLFWNAEHKSFSYTRIATPYMKKSNNHIVDSIDQHACSGMQSTYIVTPFEPHTKRARPSNRFIHVCETRPICVKRHLATKDFRSCFPHVYESIKWPDVCVKWDLYMWKETS